MACAAYAACAPDFLYLEGGFCSFLDILKIANARADLIRQSLHYLLCFRSLRGKVQITRPCRFCICSTSPQGHGTTRKMFWNVRSFVRSWAVFLGGLVKIIRAGHVKICWKLLLSTNRAIWGQKNLRRNYYDFQVLTDARTPWFAMIYYEETAPRALKMAVYRT